MTDSNSNNNSNNEDEIIPPPPSFSGYSMTKNISLSMDDGGEEVTRRIGGNPSFNPSFNPGFTSTAIAPPSFSSSLNSAAVFNSDPSGASFDTTVRKGQQQQQDESSQKLRWMLKEAPTLPEFYQLERTAVFVPHTYSASKVSQRISNVLCDRSIEAHFVDDKAEASCVTADGVEFSVFLYRGKKQYSHGVIVEVQRRFGTSVGFSWDAQAILDAAEGKMKAAAQATEQEIKSLPECQDVDDDFSPNAKSSLKMVSKMLSHNGYDAQYLAMQTLSPLTDPSKVGMKTATSIAKELLQPGNEVGQKIAAIILNSSDKKGSNNDQFGVRPMSLSILSNVLKCVSGKIPDDLQGQLLPVLQDKLRNAENSTREAHNAAKCAEQLIGAGAYNDSLIEALEMAAQVGKAKHTGLKRQAELCLKKVRM